MSYTNPSSDSNFSNKQTIIRSMFFNSFDEDISNYNLAKERLRKLLSQLEKDLVDADRDENAASKSVIVDKQQYNLVAYVIQLGKQLLEQIETVRPNAKSFGSEQSRAIYRDLTFVTNETCKVIEAPTVHNVENYRNSVDKFSRKPYHSPDRMFYKDTSNILFAISACCAAIVIGIALVTVFSVNPPVLVAFAALLSSEFVTFISFTTGVLARSHSKELRRTASQQNGTNTMTEIADKLEGINTVTNSRLAYEESRASGARIR